MKRLNARALRTTEIPDPAEVKKIKKKPIYIILDNVLDTYNIGAIFRLADATAATKIFLCGQTETPPNPRIKKASVSTWKWVDWEYSPTAVEIIKKLKSPAKRDQPMAENIKIVAIEQNKKSIPLKDFKPTFPICLVVGNESVGVTKETLEKVDKIVELPMHGVNKSLNVMVCLGIVLYRIIDNF